MKTIQLQVHVDETRTLTVQLPRDVAPGEHRVVVLLDEANGSGAAEARQPLDLPLHHSGAVVGAATFRREEIYDDDGR